MDKKHIVALSGGKDSTAMLFRMLEKGMPVDLVIFADTGKEFDQMYEHLENVDRVLKEKHNLEITRLTPDSTWDDWFFGKVTRGKMKGKQRGFPLAYFPCWWSRESKFKTMDPICLTHERYIGIAADEPKRLTEKEGYNYPLAEWGWSEKDCLEYLVKIGMDVKLHHDFKRTGCWCCPKQSIESLKILCEKYPDQWAEIRRMETVSSNAFKPNVSLDAIEAEVNNAEAYCEWEEANGG